MASHKPTNSDIIKELRAMQNTQLDHSSRLSALESWRIGQEAAKRAIEEYESRRAGSGLNKDLVKAIGTALAIISALVLFYVNGSGS